MFTLFIIFFILAIIMRVILAKARIEKRGRDGYVEVPLSSEIRYGVPIGIVSLSILFLVLSVLHIVQAGEVRAVKFFGKVSDKPLTEGIQITLPVVKLYSFSIRDQIIDEAVNVPSQENQTVDIDLTLRYRHAADAVPLAYKQIGTEDIVRDVKIIPILRSSARDQSIKFNTMELYTSKKAEYQLALETQLQEELAPYIIVDAIEIRDVRLPKKIEDSIQEKLKAEQDSQAEDFKIEQDRKIAERKRIEAQGIADANKIIDNTLTANYIAYSRVTMMEKLANSSNSTFIIIPENMQSPPVIIGK